MLYTYPVFLSNNGDKIPANIRVVEPGTGSKQAERGSLYAVVDLRGSHPEREHIAEQMLSELQNGYYSLKGKQSAVLSGAVQQAMDALADFNSRNSHSALTGGVIAAGILNSRLMIASAGPLFAMLSIGKSVEMFPLEEGMNASDAAPELILRREVNAGDALFLGAAAWEDAISLRVLAATVAHIDLENRYDAASGILEQVRSTPPPGMFLIVNDEAPTTRNAPASPKTPGARRSSLGGLPTSVGAQPPTVRPATSGDTPRREELASEELPKLDTGHPLPPLEEETYTEEQNEAESGRARPAALPSETPLDRLARLFKGILPEAKAPARKAATSSQVAAQEIQSAISQETPPARQAVESAAPKREPFSPPPPARGGRARMFILAALAIALITAAIVAGTVWQKGANQRAEAEAQLGIALARVGSAQTATDTGSKESALAMLAEARAALKAREEILAGTDPQGDELAQQIALIEQQVLQVQRLYGLIQPLIQFPSGSRPTRVLVVDQDVYILDEGRQVVERYRLDASKESVPDPTAQALIRQGDTIGDAQVGPLVDFTWQQPVPGVDDKANLFILDANNNVFRFNPRVDGAGLINLGGTDKIIKNARQLKTFSGRLYVADVGNNQLYRFQPGEYETTPEAWFPEGTQYDLTGLHTLRIDGNIWMLFENGKILRFFNGQQAPFALDERLGPAQQPVDLAVSEEDNGRLYLADRAQSRVIVYDKNGAYISQLAAPEGNPLQNLSGLFIEDVTNTLYLLTDNALFQHDLPE